jgi:hypothetical protein
MKQCTKCNEVKELTEFYNCHNGSQGKQSRCKTCGKDRKARRRWVEKNRGWQQEWRERNRASVAEYSREYQHKRYHSDPAYRLMHVLRKRSHKALNGNAKASTTLELLGCTAEHARFHIESQFTEGMTWDNIHVDHIQPCASFDLEDPIEQRKCFHYTNLQPLLAEDNLRKSDSIVAEHQVKLL